MTQLSEAHAFHRFLHQLFNRFSRKIEQDMSKSRPNIDKKFVELYAELQKLDHLTCSKLKRPSINPLH